MIAVRRRGIVAAAVRGWRRSAGFVRVWWRALVVFWLAGTFLACVWVVGWRTMAVWLLGVVSYAVVTWPDTWPLWSPRFGRWARPVLGWWRRVVVYQRRVRAVIAIAGLAGPISGRRYLPGLLKVTSCQYADPVAVAILAGHDLDGAAWLDGFGAVSCQVAFPSPGRVELTFVRREAVAEPDGHAGTAVGREGGSGVGSVGGVDFDAEIGGERGAA
ncbi:hypothetical protein AB0F17_60540 [Nonomuraea sp. NPDC026600]|uniref:hypothetical protein n=1 Tax=Nonomuraea sp. NPDC026600 TaxID=3155363 RepID=UPI0033CDD088